MQKGPTECFRRTLSYLDAAAERAAVASRHGFVPMPAYVFFPVSAPGVKLPSRRKRLTSQALRSKP